MPITFKNTFTPNPDFDPKMLSSWVRNKFNLPMGAEVTVGVTQTRITHGTLAMVLPFGVKEVKNNAALKTTLASFMELAGSVPASVAPGHDAAVNHVPAHADMSEEMWVDAVTVTLFPGYVPLHKVEQLYQTVPGTSSKSIYKAAFIGPKIRGALRLKSQSCSLRFTTEQRDVPAGELRSILLHLGVNNIYEDRMTGHVSLPIPWHMDPAPTRAMLGAFYAGLRPYLTSPFPNLEKLS